MTTIQEFSTSKEEEDWMLSLKFELCKEYNNKNWKNRIHCMIFIHIFLCTNTLLSWWYMRRSFSIIMEICVEKIHLLHREFLLLNNSCPLQKNICPPLNYMAWKPDAFRTVKYENPSHAPLCRLALDFEKPFQIFTLCCFVQLFFSIGLLCTS